MSTLTIQRPSTSELPSGSVRAASEGPGSACPARVRAPQAVPLQRDRSKRAAAQLWTSTKGCAFFSSPSHGRCHGLLVVRTFQSARAAAGGISARAAVHEQDTQTEIHDHPPALEQPLNVLDRAGNGDSSGCQQEDGPSGWSSVQVEPRAEILPLRRIAEEAHVEEHRRQARRVFDGYVIHEAKEDCLLWCAAWLRSESHLEEHPFERYIDSFRKRFAEQEFEAMKKRLSGRPGRCLKCICFVAVAVPPPCAPGDDPATMLQNMHGTLDVSVRQLAPQEILPGVVRPQGRWDIGAREWSKLRRRLMPAGEEGPPSSPAPMQNYGYIANVCVAKPARGKGIAYALLQVAIEAAQDWGLKDLYVHVNIANTAAYHLYKKCGFEMVHPGEIANEHFQLEDKNALMRLTL